MIILNLWYVFLVSVLIVSIWRSFKGKRNALEIAMGATLLGAITMLIHYLIFNF